MFGNIALIAFIFLTGVGLTAQAAVNSRLRDAIGQPILSALISFAVGAAALAALLATGWLGKAKPGGFAEIPWWAWLGGLFGAAYVTVAIVAVPRTGTAVLISAVVCGQMLAALVFDSLGFFGVPRVPLTAWRVGGAALVALGVLLMQKRG